MPRGWLNPCESRPAGSAAGYTVSAGSAAGSTVSVDGTRMTQGATASTSMEGRMMQHVVLWETESGTDPSKVVFVSVTE